MKVVPFPRTPAPFPRGWQTNELTTLTEACAAAIPSGEISGWEIGTTERGDPQLYLIGPAPEHDCILSISRLDRLYILEDGKGQVLFENHNITLLAEQIYRALRKGKAGIIARLTVCWCALREFFEEKIEPVLVEPIEVTIHFAPPFAILA
jgi:hypothetical protein